MANTEPTFHKLAGRVQERFDCGKKPQNDFLHQSAWNDQRERFSTTYLAYVGGMLAGYISLANDSIELTRDERPDTAAYANISALKIVQMGVDQRFQRQGVGEQLLNYGILYARDQLGAGCRYVILDAVPDKVDYYKKRGFVVNDSVHEKKLKRSKGKPPASVSVSMRFDLRDIGETRESYEIALSKSSSFTSRIGSALGFAVKSGRQWLRSLGRTR